MNTNHNALNLVTKGLLNISSITKGVVYQIVFKNKKIRGGGSAYEEILPPLYYEKQNLYNEIHKLEEDDIKIIKVHVDWDKHGKVFKTLDEKRIEVKLIKKHIKAEILKETNKNIKIELIIKPD